MAGARLPYHYNPFSQEGGLMNYPLSGVFSGTEVSNLAVDSIVTDMTFDVSAGEIILDSERFTHPGFTGVTLRAPVDLDSNEREFTIWLNPTRLVALDTDVDNKPGTPSEGELFVHVRENGSLLEDEDPYQVVERIYVYKNSEWLVSDDVRDIPYTRGNQNQYSMNAVKPEVVADNFSLSREKAVYHSTKQRPYLNQRANIVFRQPGSIQVAKVYFDGAGGAEVRETIGRNYRIRI